MNTKDNKTCARCGSLLIKLTQSTRQVGNSQFPLKTTTYRCTDSVCQGEIDRKVADFEIQKLERLARTEKNKADKAARNLTA